MNCSTSQRCIRADDAGVLNIQLRNAKVYPPAKVNPALASGLG